MKARLSFRNKKMMTYFITLININSLMRYFYSIYIATLDPSEEVWSVQNYVVVVGIAIIELIFCCGFIYLHCVDLREREERRYREDGESVRYDVSKLSLLNQGNVTDYQLYGFNYVTGIEKKSKKGDEIWIITGDVEEDSENVSLGNIISHNLDKGVIYRYFITKVGGKIDPQASFGKKRIEENNAKHVGKRLIFNELDFELIAPDIDIIIYNAMNLRQRKGFVCVEIGDDENTYVYQKLRQQDIQALIDVLGMKYSTLGRWKKRLQIMYKDRLRPFLSSIAFPYDLVSGLFIAVLGFTKILTIKEAFLRIIPAFAMYLITVLILALIDEFTKEERFQIEELLNDVNVFNETMSIEEIKTCVKSISEIKENNLLKKWNLGTADSLVMATKGCNTIWILSDLASDIATDEFRAWLVNNLRLNSKTKCKIIFPRGLEEQGRSQYLNSLITGFESQIEIHMIDDVERHYFWSKTYGLVVLGNETQTNSNIYISLGNAEKAFFKKVEPSENQSAVLLGKLVKMCSESA